VGRHTDEPMTPSRLSAPWNTVSERVRQLGLRWTPQRQTLIEVLAEADGHVTGAELVERCRARDPGTTPSTVYRTLDVLEELGLVRHAHGADGREEFHVRPADDHGHLHCAACGATWEIGEQRATSIADAFRAVDGFELDIGHVTLVGRCRACASAAPR
jgi:Fur family transcriptional regulator, ferric uptake regulator